MFLNVRQKMENAKAFARNNVAPITASAGVALGTATQLASAAAIDVTDVVSGITDQITPIGLVGGAILSVLVVILAYALIKRAMGRG